MCAPSSESRITLIHCLCWNPWTEKMILLLQSWAVGRVIPEEDSMFQENKEQGRPQTRTQALALLCSRYEANTDILLCDSVHSSSFAITILSQTL